MTEVARSTGRRPSRLKREKPSLVLSKSRSRLKRVAGLFGHGGLLLVASSSVFAVLFIFWFIARDALPFFRIEALLAGDVTAFLERAGTFFTSTDWRPNKDVYGGLAILYGSAMVTVCSALFAVPIGVVAAICLSDVLPFRLRQIAKPVVEVLAAIPSVAYGFFALIILAPLLQEKGPSLLAWAIWLVGVPIGGLAVVVLNDVGAEQTRVRLRHWPRVVFTVTLLTLAAWWGASGVLRFGGAEVVLRPEGWPVSVPWWIVPAGGLMLLASFRLPGGGRALGRVLWMLGGLAGLMVVVRGLGADVGWAAIARSVGLAAGAYAVASLLALGSPALVRWATVALVSLPAFVLLSAAGSAAAGLTIGSGTNAFNVSIILGIMALPTIVSVSEDSLSAAGRELREGSYALGATRAETLFRVVLPAARSGIFAAVILGIMRAVGETMVVWMAAGTASAVPEPWYNLFEPVRTLTATIAGDMAEAAQMQGAPHYHSLFALALVLLVFCFACNLVSEWIIRRSAKRLGG